MPVKKWRKPGSDDKQRGSSVKKGWNLVQNYPKEDPVRQVEVDLTDESASRTFEVPPLLRSAMSAYQQEVLGWLELSIVSWLNFYFAIGEGGQQQRLEEAAEGLGKSSDRLASIASQMGNLPWADTGWHDLIVTYAEGVEYWAQAIDMLARGAKFDRNNLAEEGFDLMARGSNTAERVVALHDGTESAVDMTGTLRTLEGLQPPGRVSAKSVDKAKAPWKRAVIAAGSRLNWSSSVW